MFQLHQAHVGYVPTLDGTSPIFILFLGSDARPGEQITGQRADSIHLVAINPAKEKASIIGFPRDSWVPIPGNGSNKINASMMNGGPNSRSRPSRPHGYQDRLLDAHVVRRVPGDDRRHRRSHGRRALRDGRPLLARELRARRADANGGQALAFARDRHDLPQGDFGRSENQGLLMVSALAQFKKEFAKDPSRISRGSGPASATRATRSRSTRS